MADNKITKDISTIRKKTKRNTYQNISTIIICDLLGIPKDEMTTYKLYAQNMSSCPNRE